MLPYTYIPQEIHRFRQFEEDNKEISLVPREAILVEAQSLLGIVTPSLLPCKI